MDAAGSTPVRREVRARMRELAGLFGNPGALHKEGVAAKDALEAARLEAATAIGAHADEIVFTGSGTESNNLAIFGALSSYSQEHEDSAPHVITSVIEHPSVLEPMRALEVQGARVTYLPVDGGGRLSLELFAEALTEETALVSVGMINSEIGVLQDIRAIAKVIRDRKREGKRVPLLHVDAAQAPLWVPLRMEELHADLMTLDAQKMLGPKGIGLLYVRRGGALSAQTLGGGQEGGLRSGTPSVELAAGLARALSLAQKECEGNVARVRAIRDALLSSIRTAIPEAIVNGTLERRVANNLNVSVPGLVGERAVLALSAWGVAASTRSACAAKDEELSHVLLALEPGAGGVARARTAVRFTLLPSATMPDAARAADLLKKAAKQYRDIDA